MYHRLQYVRDQETAAIIDSLDLISNRSLGIMCCSTDSDATIGLFQKTQMSASIMRGVKALNSRCRGFRIVEMILGLGYSLGRFSPSRKSSIAIMSYGGE